MDNPVPVIGLWSIKGGFDQNRYNKHWYRKIGKKFRSVLSYKYKSDLNVDAKESGKSTLRR